MKKTRTLIVSAIVFLSVMSMATPRAGAATKDEMTDLLNGLAKANKEVMAYREKLLATPQIVGLKKEVGNLEKSLKIKNKEFEDSLDGLYNKNSAYADLSAKLKESYAISAELNKIHNDIESAPEIKNMKKEAADLRAKAFAIEKEERKLTESKFNANEKVKKLQEKRTSLGNPAVKLAEVRKNVMNSPDVKVLQTEVANLKDNLATKNNALRKMQNNALKTLDTDEKFKALEQNASDLRRKVKNSRKAPPVISTSKTK